MIFCNKKRAILLAAAVPQLRRFLKKEKKKTRQIFINSHKPVLLKASDLKNEISEMNSEVTTQ